MAIRKATARDIDAVSEIYKHIHACEEAGELTIGWKRGIYPTRKTAQDALFLGDLFVLEDGGRVLASCRINQTQVPEYANADWLYQAPDSEVMVLHTLTVEPSAAKHGYGSAMLDFYEKYALEQGCHYLRIDTNAINAAARSMYSKRGWREAGILPCTFNGIPGVMLVCPEKKI